MFTHSLVACGGVFFSVGLFVTSLADFVSDAGGFAWRSDSSWRTLWAHVIFFRLFWIGDACSFFSRVQPLHCEAFVRQTFSLSRTVSVRIVPHPHSDIISLVLPDTILVWQSLNVSLLLNVLPLKYSCTLMFGNLNCGELTPFLLPDLWLQLNRSLKPDFYLRLISLRMPHASLQAFPYNMSPVKRSLSSSSICTGP